MSPEDAAADLWSWSLDFYRKTGVKGDLLLLQDRYGRHVTITLWGLWAPVRGWAPDEAAVREIVGTVKAMADFAVEPLRQVRRYLTAPKPGFAENDRAALRKAILANEIEAERLLLQRLAGATLTALGPPPTNLPPMAARHMRGAQIFSLCQPTLEKPMLFADDGGPEAEATILDRLLAKTMVAG